MASVTSETVDQAVILYGKETMEDTIVSMQELVNSPAITLTVGPDRYQTTIQTTLFRGMSRGLHQLLNSPSVLEGDVEFVNTILQHDDRIAFTELLRAAYAAIVKCKATTTLPAAPTKTTKSLGSQSSKATLSRAPCPSCKCNSMQLAYTCVSCNPYISENDEDVLGLDTFFLVQFYQSVEMSLAEISRSMEAGTTKLQMAIDKRDPISSQAYTLLHFAKVYTLANKYEIQPVTLSALTLFYRRLKVMHTTFHDAEEDFIDELIDALRYLSSNASKTVPFSRIVPPEYASEGSNNTSSSLVDHTAARARGPDPLTALMRFMLVHIDGLLAKREFREIIAGNGALGLLVLEILRQGIDLSD